MQYGNQSRQPAFHQNSPAGYRMGQQPRPKRSSFRIIPTALLTGILGVVVITWLHAEALRPVFETQAHMLTAEITAPIVSGQHDAIQSKRLETEINALIEDHAELKVSVIYTDLSSNRTFTYGSNGTFTAASVGKLITASNFLDDVDKGKRSLNDTIQGATGREHLEAMIEVSDNQSWLALNQTLGHNELEAYADKIGIKNYDAMENTLPAEGIALLLQKLYTRQLLSKSSTDLLLGHMKKANYRQYIVAAVTDGSTVYHKVGFLEDRVLDAAIIDNGKRPYVLVIFTEAKNGVYNFTSGGQLIKDITKSVHQGYAL